MSESSTKTVLSIRTDTERVIRIDAICAEFRCSRTALAKAALAALQDHNVTACVWMLGEPPPEGSDDAELAAQARGYLAPATRDTVPAPAPAEAP